MSQDGTTAQRVARRAAIGLAAFVLLAVTFCWTLILGYGVFWLLTLV